MHERTATAAATFLAESADKGGGPRGLLRRFIRSRIQGVRVGAKCTVMVYGPTGSGKSHTMFGYARQPDIVYRALRDILDGGAGRGSGGDEDDVGRVFVHCCQGVPCYTSLVIAYLMCREGQSFDDAFQFVKAARGIANPNMGFACHSSAPKLSAQDVSVGTSLALCAVASGAQNAERALARRP
ncbi:hypothetical protein ZWY2020_049302 [Hordeum vulgare]|nr:hypothetical protein ZWY2020_049302 [Hordeum vulgare]